MAPAANCGVYGMVSGSGSCNGGELCCTNRPVGRCNFSYSPSSIVMTQGDALAFNINSVGTNGGILESIRYALAPAADTDVRTSGDKYTDCSGGRCKAPPGGYGTTIYAQKPTNGVCKGCFLVSCTILDASGGTTKAVDLTVNPINTPGGGGASGTAWWQVVNGDVISGGDLVSKVPSAGSNTTIYNDADPAVVYNGTNNYQPFNPYTLVFDFHYIYQNASASLTFNGSSVSFIYTRGGGYKVNVFIDGIQVDTVDESKTPVQYQASKTYNVTPGSHTIKISNTVGGYSNVDGFKVSSGPANLNFAIPPSLAGYPGVAMYNGNYDFTSDSASQGTPSTKGWLVNSDYTGKLFNTDYFKSNLSTSLVWNQIQTPIIDGSFFNAGSVSPDGFFWYRANTDLTVTSPITVAGTRKVVLWVSGNLTLKGNATITNPGQGTIIVMIAQDKTTGTGGKLIIDPAVTILNGLFLADGPATTGAGSVQLNVLGSFVAQGGITLQRDLGANNATTPGEVFTYDPRLIFLLPGSLGVHRTVWREIAP